MGKTSKRKHENREDTEYESDPEEEIIEKHIKKKPHKRKKRRKRREISRKRLEYSDQNFGIATYGRALKELTKLRTSKKIQWSNNAKKLVSKLTEDFQIDISDLACKFMVHAGRKTVTKADFDLAALVYKKYN